MNQSQPHRQPYLDLEIRILKKEAQGYPVELTVEGRQQFQGGYLTPDLLSWIASASPQEDGERLFNWLFGYPQGRVDETA
jgi:hypothetical protein